MRRVLRLMALTRHFPNPDCGLGWLPDAGDVERRGARGYLSSRFTRLIVRLSLGKTPEGQFRAMFS